MSDESGAKQLARACSDSLHRRDNAAQMLGITIVDTGPGRCELSMSITESMLNGHGVCHGGILFALADTALAHASNSRNRLSVASICHIDFLRPAGSGNTITASAVERFSGRRKGCYDIELHDQQAQLIALFRGETVSTDFPVIVERGDTNE